MRLWIALAREAGWGTPFCWRWEYCWGLLAAALAGLVQRSGAWQLGELQTRLNAALQSSVGDGLHGLKAVRAAGAEPRKLPARGDCPATETLCRVRSGRGRADACRGKCWHHGGPGQWFGLTPPERATMGQRVERRSRERFDFASVAPQLLLMLRGKLIRPLFH